MLKFSKRSACEEDFRAGEILLPSQILIFDSDKMIVTIIWKLFILNVAQSDKISALSKTSEDA